MFWSIIYRSIIYSAGTVIICSWCFMIQGVCVVILYAATVNFGQQFFSPNPQPVIPRSDMGNSNGVAQR